MKAWCKTAQLVLDHLHDGCELVICMHIPRYASNWHAYVWQQSTGQVIRVVQDSIAERLFRDGFVLETRRKPCEYPCYDGRYHDGGRCWKAFYRATRKEEDHRIHACRNAEREAVFQAFLALQERQEQLQHLSYHSESTTQFIQLLEAAGAIATTSLQG